MGSRGVSCAFGVLRLFLNPGADFLLSAPCPCQRCFPAVDWLLASHLAWVCASFRRSFFFSFPLLFAHRGCYSVLGFSAGRRCLFGLFGEWARSFPRSAPLGLFWVPRGRREIGWSSGPLGYGFSPMPHFATTKVEIKIK